MIWKYRQVDALPCLAWCLHARLGRRDVTVLHGPWVETRPDGFVEGAWDGDFTKFDFDQAAFFTGSGARRADAGFSVVTASSSLDAVFVARRDDSLLASNSLVFLLEQLDDAPQPAYPLYDLRFRRFYRDPRERGRTLMTTRGGVRIYGHFAHNLRIRADLSVEILEKNKPPAVGDFAGYHELLQQSVTRLVDNAQAPQRRKSYAPITTLSQGYDSAAVSCLAARAGCRESLSFYVERDGRRIDSGAEIAAHLGLECLELPKDAYRSAPGIADAEFQACPNGNGVVWRAMEEPLHGRLLFVGDFGDQAWKRVHRAYQLSNFATCKEFRLRTGFLIAAPAYLSMHALPAVRAITNSKEMAPWRVESRYDRPIPRRIIEESGVPGIAIARDKQAHGHIWSPDARCMTTRGRRDYETYLRHLEKHTSSSQLSRSRLQHRVARAVVSARRTARKRLKRLRKQFPGAANYVMVPRLRDWDYCFLFQWGVERTRERYRIQACTATEVQAATAGQ